MKLTKYFAIVAIIFSLTPKVECSEIDSIKKLLPQLDDTSYVNTAIHLSNLYLRVKIDSAITYGENALKVSKRIHDRKFMSKSYFMLGVAFTNRANHDKAAEHFHNSIAINKKINNENGIAQNYSRLGSLYIRIGEFDSANTYIFKTIDIYKKLGDESKIFKEYNNLGNLYLRQQKYDLSIKYFRMTLSYRENLGDLDAMANVYNNMGNVHFKMENLDSALSYYQKTLEIDVKSGNKAGMGSSYNNIGVIYKNLKDYKKALENHNASLEIDREINNTRGVAASLNNLGGVYKEMGQYQRAIDTMLKCLEITQRTKDKVISKDVLLNLSETYTRMEDFKNAYEYLSLYSLMSDSILNEQTSNKIAEMEAKYEFERKNHKIALLNARHEKDNQTMTAIVLVSVLIFVLIIVIYNRYKVKQNLSMQMKELQYEQKLLRLQMNPHFIFNSLGAIGSFVSQNNKTEASLYLGKFAKLIRAILEHSRKTEIPLEDVVENLERYIDLEKVRFHNSFDYRIDVEEDLKDFTMVPPLLVQPFVENAILHGINHTKKDGLIDIRFFCENNKVVCTVEDNGIGREKAKSLNSSYNPDHKSLATEIITRRLKMGKKKQKDNLNIEIVDLYDTDGSAKGTQVRIELKSLM
jgi:tetratricopeptide (TPR) repeat protein